LAVGGVTICALLALTLGCATNPVSGKREFSLVTPEQEIQMGREGHPAVLAEFGAYEDRELQTYVDSIGQALARESHLPNLEWHFTLLDDPAVNAFALPGGYIYITRGILAHLNSEAQLAGVLGHEIGHVTARHSAQRATQQQVAGLGLGLAGIFSPAFQRYSGAAQQALGLMLLKYGRDQETESDRLGVDYSTKSDWDPREIPGTYRILRRVGERSGQTLPAFLSTHPDPGDRETRTRELANAAAAGRNGLIVGQKKYLTELDGVVFGVDPRAGFFEGTTFYHPELNFELRFPSGWQTRNTRAAVLAASQDQRAIMQVSLVDAGGRGPEDYVRSLHSAGHITAATGANESIHGNAAWVGRLQTRNQDGSEGTMVAAFVKRGDNMFQFLGRTAVVGAEDEGRILETARSLQPISDAAKRAAQPNVVDLVAAPAAGSLRDLLPKLGTQAVDPEEIALINDLELDETVLKGQTLKVVRPADGR
jgi:predicted Zn-dependent protease